MRSRLASLQRRGRFHISARFAGISRRGHIILEDVETPAGREPHLWVEFGQWHGQLPLPGDRVRAEAEVRTYFSENVGAFDLGLADVRSGP
jgi:hypothetical protein